MKLLALASLIGLLAVGAASAATPTQYRAKLNAICRSYAPTGKSLDSQMSKAEAANDAAAWSVAVRKLLIVNLTQAARVEVVPVPALLKPKMAPILTRMKTVDVHSRAALADSRAGKTKALISELLTIGELGTPLKKLLDAAGLQSCSWNQG